MAEEQIDESIGSPTVETQNSAETVAPETPQTPPEDQSGAPVPLNTPEAVVDGVEKPKEGVTGEEVTGVPSAGEITDGEVVEKPMGQPIPEQPKGDKGFTVRTVETGDKVYWVKDNLRHWVKNPETLKKLGFYLGSEKTIPFTELLQWNEGEPVDLTHPEAVIPQDVVPATGGEPAKTETATQPYKVWS